MQSQRLFGDKRMSVRMLRPAGLPMRGAKTGDAHQQWSVILAVDLDNLAIRSDIDVVFLALAPDLHLVLDLSVFPINLRREQLALREPILDRRCDRTRKPVDGHILLEGGRGARSREPIDWRILPSPRGHLEGDRNNHGQGDS